jgi:hypothetical protein
MLIHYKKHLIIKTNFIFLEERNQIHAKFMIENKKIGLKIKLYQINKLKVVN